MTSLLYIWATQYLVPRAFLVPNECPLKEWMAGTVEVSLDNQPGPWLSLSFPFGPSTTLCPKLTNLNTRNAHPEPSRHKSSFFAWFWPILHSCLVSFSPKWLPYLGVIGPGPKTQARPRFLPWLPTIPRIPVNSFPSHWTAASCGRQACLTSHARSLLSM